jgi:hypothetical protein
MADAKSKLHVGPDPELAAKGEELLRSQCSTPTSVYVRKVTA